nr:MAG TPA: PemK-like protein [Caudoviricetes sp.]
MQNLLNEVNSKLQDLINDTDNNNARDVKRTKNYLSALSEHIDSIKRERNFVLSEEQKSMIKRGNIVWVDFGFNIGSEFGGRHPAIILRTFNGSDTITVIPLDSSPIDQKILNKRKTKGYWVEISNIYNMSFRPRWVNTLRVTTVSVIRVDLTKLSNAYVDKQTLLNIDNSIMQYSYHPIVKK